eukprot:scaffold25981_cov54-Phaeocystis_antarctica.AAC.2
MNSHFSASSKRAKRTEPSLSASLPQPHACMRPIRCCRVADSYSCRRLWENRAGGRGAARLARTSGERRGSLRGGWPV